MNLKASDVQAAAGLLRAETAAERRAMHRAEEMDRQSRSLWLKTFENAYDPCRLEKALDHANKAVDMYQEQFPTLELQPG